MLLVTIRLVYRNCKVPASYVVPVIKQVNYDFGACIEVSTAAGTWRDYHSNCPSSMNKVLRLC